MIVGWLESGVSEAVMTRRNKDAGDPFRPSDRPVTEYEQQQAALRENLERLRTERRAREQAKSNDD
jgi:hypothetical protein